MEAVRPVREREITMAPATRDLDLSVALIRRWVRQISADPQDAFPGQVHRMNLIEVQRISDIRDALEWTATRNG